MDRADSRHLAIIGANLLASLIFACIFIFADSSSANVKQPTVLGETTLSAPVYSDSELDQIAKIVNQKREVAGLKPLLQSPKLDAIAAQRAADMQSNAYYAHKSPNGQYFNDLMTDQGISFTYACENLNLAEEASPEKFVDSWLESKAGHRECLLSKSHVSAGYAISTVELNNGLNIKQKVIVAIYSDSK